MKKILIVLVIILSIVALWYFQVGRYRSVGKPISDNGLIKSSLANIRANSALIYEDKKSYDSVCTNEINSSMRSKAEKIGKTTSKCFADSDSFVVSAKLKDEINGKIYFCVDSTGSAKEITVNQDSQLTTPNTLCP